MTVKKIAVIGWDAATFEVVLPLLKAGVLPNLQRLMESGAWGNMLSTLHPISPTAWASFSTGMNPGKHAIFDFVGLTQSMNFKIMNGSDIKSPSLWAQLSSAGKTVGVVNVPMTYPPEPVNGFVISGMDAPQQGRAFTYPPELAHELLTNVGVYRVGVPSRSHLRLSVEQFTNTYVENLTSLVEARCRTACYLLEKYPLDFFMIVFTAPDRVQHALGHLLAQGISPTDGIAQVYQACDRALEEILKRLDKDWITLIVSDHGACAYQRVFELGTWLVEQGWLKLLPQTASARFKQVLSPVYRYGKRLMGQSVANTSSLDLFLNRIAWEETKAFALGAFGSIFINTCERFAHGTVRTDREYQQIAEQIKEQLMNLCDPDTGNAIVTAVHQSRDIYSGPYVHLAPDLLVETTNNYFIRNNLDHFEGRVLYAPGRYRGRSIAHTGRHTLEGILVASGAPFEPAHNLPAVHITDVAPTLLYLLGIPVPLEMDGQPLLTWLNHEYTAQHPLQCSSMGVVDTQTRFDYSEEDQIKIEQRLKDLGYMG